MSMINRDQRMTEGAQLFSQEYTAISPTGRVLNGLITVSTIATAAAVTLTPAQVLGGLVLRDPAGGARADVLPTAALLRAALPEVKEGTGFEFTIRNTADAAETITVTAGAGGTVSGTATIAQSNSKRFLLVFTNTSPSAPTYTVYSLGTVVH